MIQVSRRIAVLGPVNQRAVRQSEQIGQSIVPCHGAGLVRGVATTGVSADQGPGWQLAYREDTVAMHATMAHSSCGREAAMFLELCMARHCR